MEGQPIFLHLNVILKACFFSALCQTGDPLYVVKIIIGPVICSVLLLLVAIGGFVMFKKK